jgi:hypothetical protein
LGLATDERRLTPIENNDLGFALSALIRVHRRLNGFSSVEILPPSKPRCRGVNHFQLELQML